MRATKSPSAHSLHKTPGVFYTALALARHAHRKCRSGLTLGWSALDGRDVLFYVQTNFPTGFENPQQAPAEIQEVENEGGPAQNWITGILTAFGAMTVSLGFAVLIGAALIGIILLLVWFLRNQKS